MTTPELLDFIKKSLASGVTPDQIRNSLISQRWNESDINEAFTQITETPTSAPPPTPTPQPEIQATSPQVIEPTIPVVNIETSPNIYTEPQKSRLPALIVSIVLFVVLALSAAGGYYYYTQVQLTPEQILERAFTNGQLLKTAKFAGTTHVKFALDIPKDSMPEGMPQIGPGDYNIKFNGAIDNTDTLKPRFAVTGNGSFSMNFMGLKISAEGRGESIFIDNIIYFKINLPDILKSVGADFLNNTWIQAEIPTAPSMPPNPLSDTKELEKLKTLFSSKKIISEIKELPKENGAYHFALTYDLDEFAKIALTALNSSSAPTTMTKKDEKIFTDLFKNIKFTKSEIWIDTNSFYTKRILFQIDYTSDLKELIGNAGQLAVSFEMDTSYNDFNKPAAITAPSSAKTIEELTNAAANNPLSSLFLSRAKARDARRIADAMQIRLALEIYADDNDNYHYPNTLSVLAPKYIYALPTDPTNTAYSYSVNNSLKSYHLGVSLEVVNNNSLKSDIDCNSKTGTGCDQKLPFDKKTSFDGSDQKGCKGEIGRYCYDITP